ncbi:MAG: DNA-processing protein DprA [Candidatus Delongbacteria bacterium]|jgi:DNA processing protein|nr:DNA-processing protein DprA [Candidatus Delongbacteria bacterium]
MQNKLQDIFRLEAVKYLTPVSLKALLNQYDTAEECKHLSDEELIKAGISKAGRRNLREISFDDTVYQQQLEAAEKLGNIKVVTFYDDEYPANLRNIFDPPLYLFFQGEISPKDDLSIAIVGSRTLSRTGIQTIKKVSRELAAAGFVIISGLAMGADTVAHLGAIEAKARTVAILGSGIDKEVNVCSRGTRRKIIETGGAVLSPFKIGYEGTKYSFPARNRVISGMSLGVIIGEAKMKSGSLITASFGLDQGREVFALPNLIYKEKFEGSNNLIKTGSAKLIMGTKDVIDEMPEYVQNLLSSTARKVEDNVVEFNDKLEEKVYKTLLKNKMNIDELSEKLSIDTGTLMSKLLMLELNGLILREPNNFFCINK